jgi:hypothetical protein
MMSACTEESFTIERDTFRSGGRRGHIGGGKIARQSRNSPEVRCKERETRVFYPYFTLSFSKTLKSVNSFL